ncbi:MAG: UvrD-helicase domain-containing protein [Burkholderiales bacterium]
MNAAPIGDYAARKEALDPSRSFIVQAPAGSGKTELLIQRYLVLLSRVAQPEEIAAITFTRKAAAEMRKRVLEALASARSGERPPEPHRVLTWEHARAAIERDRAQGWHLEENAARLRIQTFDALCASFTRQMPVLAAFGAQPEPLEDAMPLYIEAARATLALLEEKDERAELVATLLVHLDNNVKTAADLIAGMLQKRDHWLRNLSGAHEREALEAALAAECRAQLAKTRALFPAKPPVPLPSEGDVAGWKQLATGLLTQKGEWRKKDAAAQALSGNDPLREALAALPGLPLPRYADAQWGALDAITQVLPLAVAELKLVFAAHGRADFVEIAQGASAALGDADAPTDLLLSLDYRIHHLLVDEFQDTSFTQFELLQKLTAGWQPDDGRTLFLVGDPMQSIYRFREAEVGLFLRARHGGIGSVALEPLTLSVNLRSQAGIVDWVNGAFEQVMPRAEDIAAGAVPYTRCEPEKPAESDAVRVHAFFDGDAEGEAAQVAALAAEAQAEGTVAILVRNRGHLEHIVPKLKAQGVRFRAIEIEKLGHRQVVQDLLALTRALAHPADRLAWLACLRAPWCGLTLADLHALAGTDRTPLDGHQQVPSPVVGAGQGEGTTQIQQDFFAEVRASHGSPAISSIDTDAPVLWELMHDDTRLARLSADGRARLARTRDALVQAMANRLRGSLRDRVEGAWLALGGPACVETDTDVEDAGIYLDYLEESEEAGEIADPAAFEEGLDDLYALPDLHARPNDPQILTIHKAKGLEFDTVIVPGLGSGTGRDERELFVWMERPAINLFSPEGSWARVSAQLLLAPINPTGSDKDPTYEYIRGLGKEKGGHEDGRLLYVAATRAKKHLHLLGDVRLDANADEPEPKSPSSGSLLARLWPAVESDFAAAARTSPLTPSPPAGGEGRGEGAVNQDLRRLPSDWTLPSAPPAASWSPPQDTARAQDDIEFSWVGETARHVGSVVHRWLQRIAADELRGWHRARVEKMRDGIRRELAARGVEESELEAASARVASALANALDDQRGRWLLGPQRESRSEHRLTALIGGERRTLIIDRTFVDAEDRHWIVDYKTSGHEGANVEAFLDRERERYRAQLERYAAALAAKDAKLGLYFPLLAQWREWDANINER